MAGYTPLFSSLTTGTLCGKWPDIGLWPIVLSLADRYGIVDVTPDYLCRVTGLQIEAVTACMQRFCEPDPYSRSQAEKGARLTLIDPSRQWGWQVVNHRSYREKARKATFDAARVEDGRNAERQSRAQPRSAARTRAQPPSDSDSDSDSDSEKNKNKTPPLPRVPPDRAAAQPEPGEFVEIRRDFPKRAGAHRWHDALRAYRARVGEGHAPQAILAGVRRYAAFIRASGKERTEYVQQAATFLGKNLGFELPWNAPAKPETAGDRLFRSLNGDDSKVIDHDPEFPALPRR